MAFNTPKLLTTTTATEPTDSLDNHHPNQEPGTGTSLVRAHGGGPKTALGKMKSAQNARKHSFYAKSLFCPGEVDTAEYAEYSALLLSLALHFQPCGIIEELLVEKVATEMIRLRRFLALERSIFSKSEPLMHPALDKLLRYQSALNRQFYQALAELERLQRRRLGEDVPAPVSVDMRIDAPGSLESLQPAPTFPAGLPPAPPATSIFMDKTLVGEAAREANQVPLSQGEPAAAQTTDEDSCEAEETTFCKTNSRQDEDEEMVEPGETCDPSVRNELAPAGDMTPASEGAMARDA